MSHKSNKSKLLKQMDNLRAFVAASDEIWLQVSEGDLGKQLNRWRRQAGYTQQQLGDEASVGIKTVNKLCQGQFSPTQWQIVVRVLQAVGASIVVRGPDGQGHVLGAL